MATDPVNSVRGIIEIAERLFGRLGPAILIATLIYFLAPRSYMTAIGIDSANPTQRLLAGVLLILSLATSAVSLVAASRELICSAFGKISDWRAYRSLPIESRVLLGMYAHFRNDSIIAPPDCEAVQTLVDHGYMTGSSQFGQLIVGLTMITGTEFVSKFREQLRRDAKVNSIIAENLAKELDEARQKHMAKSANAWTAG